MARVWLRERPGKNLYRGCAGSSLRCRSNVILRQTLRIDPSCPNNAKEFKRVQSLRQKALFCAKKDPFFTQLHPKRRSEFLLLQQPATRSRKKQQRHDAEANSQFANSQICKQRKSPFAKFCSQVAAAAHRGGLAGSSAAEQQTRARKCSKVVFFSNFEFKKDFFFQFNSFRPYVSSSGGETTKAAAGRTRGWGCMSTLAVGQPRDFAACGFQRKTYFRSNSI